MSNTWTPQNPLKAPWSLWELRSMPSDPLARVQGVNQEGMSLRIVATAAFFLHTLRTFHEPSSYGCPDWVPQPSIVKRPKFLLKAALAPCAGAPTNSAPGAHLRGLAKL
jgi:hypothetical protein